jgi:hypothetical protein
LKFEVSILRFLRAGKPSGCPKNIHAGAKRSVLQRQTSNLKLQTLSNPVLIAKFVWGFSPFEVQGL